MNREEFEKELGYICNFKFKDDEFYYIFEEHGSDYGEDIIFENVIKSGTPKEIIETMIKDLGDYIRYFDIDEYVDLYAPMRGKNGIPDRYTDLIDAAKENLSMHKKWIRQLVSLYQETKERND